MDAPSRWLQNSVAVKRLYIFCEGQTEETFSNLVLEPHFRALGVYDVRPLLLKRGGHKGGWTSYAAARHFMVKLVLQQQNEETLFTTLFDLYALPTDFPGLASAPVGPALARVQALEQLMDLDLNSAGARCFQGYLQLHEFEALLLSDCDAVEHAFPARKGAGAALRADIGHLAPEDVNEGPHTAPSKRIIRHIPEYQGLKTSAGPIIAAEIGLNELRARCPHFDAWIAKIEAAL